MLRTGKEQWQKTLYMAILISFAILSSNSLAYKFSTEDKCYTPVDCYSIVNCLDCLQKSDTDLLSTTKISDISIDYGKLSTLNIEKINSTSFKVTGKLIGQSAKWSIDSIGLDPFFNNTWIFCRNITITNNNAFDLINYQVPMNLTFPTNNTDFRDVRFVDTACNNGGNLLYHFQEAFSPNTWSYQWVKTNLTASSDTVISIYYNTTVPVTTDSDGLGTFQFFDDFNDVAINSTKWGQLTSSGVCTLSQIGGYFKMVQGAGASWDGCGLNSTQFYISSPPQRIILLANSSINTGGADFIFGKCQTCNGASSSSQGAMGFSISQFSMFVNNSVIASSGSRTTSTMYRMELKHNTTTGHIFTVNDTGRSYDNPTIIKDYRDTTNLDNLPYKMQTVSANDNFHVDYFFVANWTGNEPTFTISGSQTNITPTVTPSFIVVGNKTYSYICSNGFSVENITVGNISNYTSLQCNFGCSNNNAITFISNREPQGDVCFQHSIFVNNYIIIGYFIGGWLILIIFYVFSKKLPDMIRRLLMFFILMAVVYMFFVTPFPILQNVFQTDIVQYLEIISVMLLMFLTVMG